MPADRCYVGVLNDRGAAQFYQRESERKGKDGRWESVPYFVNRSEAITMSEAAARMFVARLRSLKVHSAFVEDAKDGRRIEVASESSQSGEDTRMPVTASIDDVNDYIVKPTNTPNGPKWFIRIDVPGAMDPQVIYADDPLGVLQRAADMNFLQYAPLYKRPEPQPAAPVRTAPTWRRRTGDLR